MPIFKGAGVAIVTPMKENLEVNYELLERNINYQIDNGTDAIIIAGTTGESATLSEEEHKKVVKAAIEFTKHRVPVIAGTGSNSTQTAIELSQEADKDGADAVLIVTPYYNKATQKRSYCTLYQRCKFYQSAGDHVQCSVQNRLWTESGDHRTSGKKCR